MVNESLAYNLTHISFMDNLKRTLVSKKERPQSVFSGKVTFIFPLFVCVKRRSDIENIFFNKHKIRVQPEKDGIHYNVVTYRTIKLFLKQLLFSCCSSLGFFLKQLTLCYFYLFPLPISYWLQSIYQYKQRYITHWKINNDQKSHQKWLDGQSHFDTTPGWVGKRVQRLQW